MARKAKRFADGGDVGGSGLKVKTGEFMPSLGASVSDAPTAAKPGEDTTKRGQEYSTSLGQSNSFAGGFASGMQAGDNMNKNAGRATVGSKVRGALGYADGGKVCGGKGRYYGKK